MNFEYLSPVQIIFGNGRIKELGKLARRYGDNALVVTGRISMRRHGGLERVLNNLKESGINSVVFDKISSNPKSDEVDEAIHLVREGHYNLIIGLGGGSAIDSAKAISVGINYDSIRELIGGKAIEKAEYSIPVISVPTTSGSGAEVTKGAIITDTVRNLKSGVRGSALFPKLALVDPELTYTMPRQTTLETGFDALTHAIETYVANKSNPICDLCSEKAIEIIYEYLPQAIENGNDKSAREKMAFASLLGGVNIANTGTCLPHRMQQAMGSVIDISHGRGMATLYPAWLEKVSPYREGKFNKISELLGNTGESHQAVINFMQKIGIYCSLGDYARMSYIDKFLEKTSGNIENDPLPNIDQKLMREIYEKSF